MTSISLQIYFGPEDAPEARVYWSAGNDNKTREQELFELSTLREFAGEDD
ncbi:MAG: hypothetical protein AAFQ13_08295 [Pseudomonadota bacterium]